MDKKNNKMISKSKFSIIKNLNNKDWNSFLLDSQNKSIFMYTDYLNLEKNINKFIIRKNKQVVALIALKIEKKNNISNIIELDRLIYTPIIFRNINNSSEAKKNFEKYEIIEFLTSYLTENYNNINFTLDFHSQDIRPFVWFGFPKYKKKFLFNINYTSLLNLNNIDNKEFEKSTMFQNFSNTLRQQYRYSLKNKIQIEENLSKKVFLKLLEDTFKLQKLKFDKKYYAEIFSVLIKLNKKNLIKMYYVKDQNNFITNMAVFSLIGNFSTFMFSGRNSQVDNNNFNGIYLLIKAFKLLKNNGIKTIDLEGINSPKRGFYKIGLGGNILPYYSLEIKNCLKFN